MHRRALAPILMLAAVHGVAACGGDGRMREEAATGAAPVVTAFLADLGQGRVEQALARTTPAFRSSANRDAVAESSRSMAAVLGELRSVGEPEVSRVLPMAGTDPPAAGVATLSWPGRYRKGDAKIAARVERGADGAWRIDAFAVEGALFTWALRR